jgi:hypothetical protein
MAEPKRTRLGVQRTARAHPVKERGTGDFRHELVAE